MTTTKKDDDATQLADAAARAGIDPNDIMALLDLEAPAWNPDEGEKIAGWIVSLKIADSEFGEYPLATVLTEDGELVTFHGFHKIARDALGSAQQGDRIGIKYKGRKESKIAGRSDYADYNVIVQQRVAVARPTLRGEPQAELTG